MKDELKLFLALWGIRIGTILVCAPIIYDIIGIFYGRDLKLGIGFWGVISILAGLVFAWIGDRCEKNF